VKKTLQEINKLAAINASKGLKKLFKQEVKLKIPKAQIKDIRKLKPLVGREVMTVGIYLPITGDIKGASLLVFPKETAFALSDSLLKRKQGSTRTLKRIDKAALKEVGNIICGNYFTVFGNMLGIKLIEHVPIFSYSMFGAIISDIIVRFSQKTKEALVIEIEIIFKPKKLKGYFLLLFEPVKITKFL